MTRVRCRYGRDRPDRIPGNVFCILYFVHQVVAQIGNSDRPGDHWVYRRVKYGMTATQVWKEPSCRNINAGSRAEVRLVYQQRGSSEHCSSLSFAGPSAIGNAKSHPWPFQAREWPYALGPRPVNGRPPLSRSANRRRAAGLNRSTGPVRSLVLRTSTQPVWSATSTQLPPPFELYDVVRQFKSVSSIAPPPLV